MDVKLAAAVADPDLKVRAWCRRHGISRSTFYKYKQRYEQQGLAGLEPRSTRPRSSPSAISAAVEDAIVRIRKDLDDGGWDSGADSILSRLELELAMDQVPSRATIWRVLGRRGLIVPEPRKRPHAAYRRFEWARPNDCWQIDATHWTLASNTIVDVINIIDDHSRVLIASVAVPVTTGHNAWAALIRGARHWGLPGHVLSDNGSAFTGNVFTANLRAVGVTPINSRPYHPRTCGKVERFHQTLKKWLARHPAHSIRALQRLVDTFTEHYNHHRPHRACDRRPPAHKWHATPAAGPAEHPIDTPLTITTAAVDCKGRAEIAGYSIALGNAHAGRHVTLILHAQHCAVFHHDTLIRQLDINPTRRYQPLYNRPGRPPDSVRNVPRHNGPR